MTTLTAPLTRRKARLSPHARRVVRDYLVQRRTGVVYSYEYRLDPIDPQSIQVRRDTQGANWFLYGDFGGWLSAAIALDALRMAQAREQAER